MIAYTTPRKREREKIHSNSFSPGKISFPLTYRQYRLQGWNHFGREPHSGHAARSRDPIHPRDLPKSLPIPSPPLTPSFSVEKSKRTRGRVHCDGYRGINRGETLGNPVGRFEGVRRITLRVRRCGWISTSRPHARAAAAVWRGWMGGRSKGWGEEGFIHPRAPRVRTNPYFRRIHKCGVRNPVSNIGTNEPPISATRTERVPWTGTRCPPNRTSLRPSSSDPAVPPSRSEVDRERDETRPDRERRSKTRNE